LTEYPEVLAQVERAVLPQSASGDLLVLCAEGGFDFVLVKDHLYKKGEEEALD
jgi:hypothetical protein